MDTNILLLIFVACYATDFYLHKRVPPLTPREKVLECLRNNPGIRLIKIADITRLPINEVRGILTNLNKDAIVYVTPYERRWYLF